MIHEESFIFEDCNCNRSSMIHKRIFIFNDYYCGPTAVEKSHSRLYYFDSPMTHNNVKSD